MKKPANRNKKKIEVQRNKYTTEHKEKARKYYLMGLSLQEISKLLDGASVRTLEKWQINGKWTAIKEVQPIRQRVLEMRESGKSYKEITEILKISHVTVWRYCKEAKESRTNLKELSN